MGIRGFTISIFLLLSLSFLLYTTNLLLSSRNNCSPEEQIVAVSATSIPNNTTTTHTQPTNATVLLHDQTNKTVPQVLREPETNLSHIVFGIAASSNLWEQRKLYIKEWWRPRETRGIVWLDKMVNTSKQERLPEIRISEQTDNLPYKHTFGSPSALRISRIVSETLRLKLKNVRWIVMGDDDTVFIVDNVVRVLKNLDHRGLYYIGSPSESHIQNLLFSYNMAYGGGGFAISYPLAVELEKMQDRCIARYAQLYGSDDRIHACMSELGVPLTRHRGFHQVRLRTWFERSADTEMICPILRHILPIQYV